MELTGELLSAKEAIESHARDFGLDFFPVNFEPVDYRTMNQLAAFDGFPTRYSHWRFGMSYEQLSKSYAYGLHRIYEMVINTNPCYAYLLTSNALVDQKLVMAHVYGHSDFFKSNLCFAGTNRQMLNEMANHGSRIRRYASDHGSEEVEGFLDACLSLDNLIDIHGPGIGVRPEEDEDVLPQAPPRLRAKPYMEPYINPADFLAEQQRKLEEERERRKQFPARPQRDVLWFLLEYAPLEAWQHNVLEIVREEAYYFTPQRQTKIMNEGWASYVHSHIMTRHVLEPDELIDYADHHSGTMATQPGRMNPYKLGLELYRDIEDRWNRGAFGPEFEECNDLDARQNWDRGVGLGREKLFEVRRIYNDVTFIDAFLTEEFARKQGLFTFRYNPGTENYEVASRDFQEVKRGLLTQLTNAGQPIIDVVDGNYQNRGELYLLHKHEGTDLDVDFAKDTLKNLFRIWGRPVHLETVVKGKGQELFSQEE